MAKTRSASNRRSEFLLRRAAESFHHEDTKMGYGEGTSEQIERVAKAIVDAAFKVHKACVIIEIKSVEALHPVHTAQAITYLKLTGKRLCLLINFNVPLIKDGIKRIIL